MSVFAQENKVLWVERLPEFRTVLTRGRHDRGGQGTASTVPSEWSPRGREAWGVRQISDNLYVFSYPKWAPISGRPPLKQLTRTIRRKLIHDAMRTLGMLPHRNVLPHRNGARGRGTNAAPPIVWFSQPRMVDLVQEIPSASVLLYHVVDEYTAYKDVTIARRQRLVKQEREMMDTVDAVIVVSKALYEAKRPYNKNTYLVPNGVNYAAYSEALADRQLAQELEGIAAPRLGYSGLIGDRLDMGMLRQLAEEHPEWSLVFLGEARVTQQAEEWEAMLRLPNVHYVGQVDVSRVPYILKGFQVGLMPYALGLESENISPLKLYDYMAAGLPVASVDIPAAREFGQHVHLASGSKEFAQVVAAALADSTPERSQEQRAVAAQHTWEARVEQLSEIIRGLVA